MNDFDPIDTYTISEDGGSITCKRCGLTSYHQEDVNHKFCGRCGIFHDNIWPPARRWWIEQGKEKHENRS